MTEHFLETAASYPAAVIPLSAPGQISNQIWDQLSSQCHLLSPSRTSPARSRRGGRRKMACMHLRPACRPARTKWSLLFRADPRVQSQSRLLVWICPQSFVISTQNNLLCFFGASSSTKESRWSLSQGLRICEIGYPFTSHRDR